LKNEVMEMKLIGMEDLPDNYKVYLENSFRKNLIRKAVEQVSGFVKLSQIIGIDWSSLCKLRRGYRIINGRISYYFLKINLLKKLLKITNISIQDIEKNVIGLAYNKVLINTQLPIIVSPELASLTGHAFGDGHVSVERFKYVNKRKELVTEVKEFTKLIFGHEGREFFYNGCYGIEFPGIIGRLFSFIGIPLGRKTGQELKIPEWVKNGTKEVKSAFLRALFDDEGSIINSKQDFISISMYKQNNLINSHIRFLDEIRSLLMDLEINPSKVSFKKNYKETKEFGFRIYNKKSLLNFSKNVNFNHYIKSQKLFKTIERYNNLKI